MRILIIGGTRFVGPRIVRALLERGHAVTTFNRGQTGDALPAKVERLHGDRSAPNDLSRALAGRSFDGCVDMIAMRGSDTESAIEILDGRIAHYVHFSTGQVYLVRKDCRTPAREEDYAGPLIPPPPSTSWDWEQWNYGVEKRECEDLLAAAWEDRGFPATRLRLTMIHGEDDPRGRIQAYVLRLRDGGPLITPIEPSPPVRPIHTDAVVASVVSILEGGLGKGAAYNLAQAETWSHGELIARLARMLNVEPVNAMRPRQELIDAGVFPACTPLAHPWMSLLDPARAARELGFEPGGFDAWLPSLVERVSAMPAPPGFRKARRRELELVG